MTTTAVPFTAEPFNNILYARSIDYTQATTVNIAITSNFLDTAGNTVLDASGNTIVFPVVITYVAPVLITEPYRTNVRGKHYDKSE